MLTIIVDSTCDLPAELMDKYDIKMLPLRVYLDDKEYIDKVNISVEEVYDAMRNGCMPMTSQPAPSDVRSLFESCCAGGNDFLYIAFSSKLSCTYQLGVSVVEELKDKYPDIRMKVVDSKSGSTATGLIALQAAKLREAGYDLDTVVESIKKLISSVEHIFTINDLSWLIKGGRITKGEWFVGNLLDIKPIIHVRDGIIEVFKKVRGKRKALNAMVDILEEKIKDFPDQIIGISHADDSNTAQELMDLIKRRLGDKNIILNKIGSVLGSHIGIGGVGIFFFNSKPELYIE